MMKKRMLLCFKAGIMGLLWPLYGNGQTKTASDTTGMEVFVTALMKKMTTAEKIGQLNLVSSSMDVTGPFMQGNYKADILKGNVGGVFNAYTPDFVQQLQQMAVKETRLGIPLLIGYDVIHGHKTVYPIPLAMSCSWNLSLIKQCAAAAAAEASADGINWVFSPMVDITRDPRWGRVTEGAGEDTWLGAQIAAAMVQGYQGSSLRDSTTVMACVKHFALYGAVQAGRDYNTVDMSRGEMYRSYLPPYQAAVAAGVGSVMTSFNEVDGIPATANSWLLQDLLRKKWSFGGLVATDYTAVNELIPHGMAADEATAAKKALHAGAEMDMVGQTYVQQLPALISNGTVAMADLDIACKHVLEAKYKLGLFSDPYRGTSKARAAQEILSTKQRALARQMARESLVLLKNEGQLLPLQKKGSIAVIGPLAAAADDILGSWSAAGKSAQAVSVLEGIKNVAGKKVQIHYAKGTPLSTDTFLLQHITPKKKKGPDNSPEPQMLLQEALNAARQSDVIVAVLGEARTMSGEAASRTDIGLPENQLLLLQQLLKTGKPVILLLMSGRPMTITEAVKETPAVLETWFAGTEGGNAIADVLFGDYNPSGHLTMTFPANTGQIPIYYNHKNTGRPFDDAQKYTSKYLDASNEPLFPFGYGISYTKFNYTPPVTDKTSYQKEDTIRVKVAVSNDGGYDGKALVQLYIRQISGGITRPVKELKAFQQVFLPKGSRQELQFSITRSDLSYADNDGNIIFEPGKFQLFTGSNAGDAAGVTISVTE